jgi:hypothetical protein
MRMLISIWSPLINLSGIWTENAPVRTETLRQHILTYLDEAVGRNSEE